MNAITNPSRRGLLATVSSAFGAFTFGFHAPLVKSAAAQGSAGVPEINVWVVVRPDDTVVIRIARSEMGQGTLTGLAQLVAEELECDWSKVTTEYPTPGQNLARNRAWGNMSTGGSRGIRDSHDYVRKGGAAARMMLVQAAANGWGVAAGECNVANSIITHGPSGRSTSFGAVAAAAARLTPPTDIPLKDPRSWKIAGKSIPRLDTAEKLNGSQIYGMDLRLPGMLNAAIRACPVFGGKIGSMDSKAAEAMPGVKHVLRLGEHTVVVVADTWWRAKTALDAVKITWDEGPHANASSAS
ncbi:MAG: molybdopterin cofactor-binding domain-containing protein, partial [Acetobacteraceae bacterium]